MVQMALFALVGFSSALVNLGVYNLVLWGLQSLCLFSGFDFLVARFFGVLDGWRRVFGGGDGRKNAKIGERNGGAEREGGSERRKTAAVVRLGKTHNLFLGC